MLKLIIEIIPPVVTLFLIFWLVKTEWIGKKETQKNALFLAGLMLSLFALNLLKFIVTEVIFDLIVAVSWFAVTLLWFYIAKTRRESVTS
jgi:hypothetical protein